MEPSPGENDAQLVPPTIPHDEAFVKIVKKLSIFITDAHQIPNTSEQLRTTSSGDAIRILVDHLVNNVTNPAIVNALLTLKWHFSALEPDDRGLSETRANACEIVAWRFLTRLAERDAVDFCLYELPEAARRDVREAVGTEENERSALLPQFRARDTTPGHFPHDDAPKTKRQQLLRGLTQIGSHLFSDSTDDDEEDEAETSSFTGLNALEIAAVADAKKFLSQRLVQKIIYGIWTGEVVFWETLSVNTVKKARFYNKRKADPFSRLRVPKYIKAFEVLFFLAGLALYYAVLVQRSTYEITRLEVLLYVWLIAFTYDEISEFVDAGMFYYTDFWSSWDLAIILDGLAFFITRIIGLSKDDKDIVEIGFDILSLEALFLVPRIFSLLSLHPYFGTLIPCLKEMTKDFIKFMAVVAILYIGFLTTFTLLARDKFTLSQMSWILVKVFFGSSYIGFDIMKDISPQLGPPLMLIFVTLSQILLVTALISILSNSFSKITTHAKEEYLYVYSVYVLEASTSNRLTHFYPPLNLLALFFRPLRLFMKAEDVRRFRIFLLKVTHAPFVGIILAYELIRDKVYGRRRDFSSTGPMEAEPPGQSAAGHRPFSAGFHKPIHDSDTPHLTPSKITAIKRKQARRMDSGEVVARRDSGGGGQGDESANARVESLERKVDDLKRNIEELTALLLAQQRPDTGE